MVGSQGEVILGDDGAIDVRDGDPHVATRDMQPRDEAGSAGESYFDSSSPAAGGLGGVEDSRGGELFDDVGDGGGRQAGGPGELDLRQMPVPLERFDDSHAVGFA